MTTSAVRSARPGREARRVPSRTEPYRDLLGATSRMQRLFRLIEKVAPSESTVLITGESGTGKELFARAIHLQSRRANGPFVPVHLGAIPENLIESELFGYVRGAFTGATAPRAGLFEEADGGTIFLDEIGETPLAVQVKLLRVLETNEVRRLGENESRIIDVRVVAATHRNLSEMVAAGTFREDLYYRLNVVQIELPPLRERREDVPLLAGYFLERFAARMGKPRMRFAPDAQALLLRYDFPGNVRELQNGIERAVTLSESDTVTASDLPPAFARPRLLGDGGGDPRETWSLDDVEREHIARVLRRQHGNLVNTARQLGISRTTLWRKMRQYGIPRPREAENVSPESGA